MVAENKPEMASFELSLDDDAELISAATVKESAPLPPAMLVQNVIWFCRLRWGIIIIFGVFGGLSIFPDLLEHIGLRTDTRWALIIAGLLTLENIYFLVRARLPEITMAHRSAQEDLFIQIILDLLV